MTNEEILQRDFQIMTTRAVANNIGLLRTIIQCQMIILNHLKPADDGEWAKTLNALYNENIEFAENALKKDTPLFQEIIFPFWGKN